jgi:hypothetical protein
MGRNLSTHMIIDSAWRPQRRLPILGCVLVLTIWFTGMALTATVVTPNAVVAFGSPARLAVAADSVDAELLNAGPAFVTLRPESRDTVRKLYVNGAWLVWPILSAGCSGKTKGL